LINRPFVPPEAEEERGPSNGEHDRADERLRQNA
jgi:hypothetical protein